MPELAEVQTLVDQLDHTLRGAQVEELYLFYPEILQIGDSADLAGKEIHRIERWGKRLRFLVGSKVLVVGLGMTGGWRIGNPVPQHRVAVLRTDRGEAWYIDPRRFGKMHIFDSLEHAQEVLGSRIGIDAAKPITDQELQAALGNSSMKLKAALLDQSRLSGIGNYLADEIAWHAQLSPTRPLSQIQPEEWSALNLAREDVIRRALHYGGLSFSDYAHVDGGRGQMSSQLQAYGRSGSPCSRCGTVLSKTTVAGRGTHYCTGCQI